MNLRLCLLLSATLIPLTAVAQPRIIWEDDAPFFEGDEGMGIPASTAGIGNLSPALNEFFAQSTTDPLSSGRGNVARLSFVSVALANIHDATEPGVVTAFDITPDDYGLPYRFSMDYLIPTDTQMDVQDVAVTEENPDGISPDLFWVQNGFNGSNEPEHRGGFIGTHNIEDQGGVLGEWQTFVFESVVPAELPGPVTTTSLTPLILFGDNAFGGGLPNGNGVDVSLYIDNIKLEILAAGQAGDFNGDGFVDAADYTTWRDNLGDADETNINDAGDGMNGVDAADYDLWVANFGMGTPPAGNGSAVPEPATCLLVMLSVVAGCGVARQR